MPPSNTGPQNQKQLEQIVEEVGLYPIEAYEFVQSGLHYTVQKLHGQRKDSRASRHVSGRDLCEGLREFALMKWGMLARMVLKRWGIAHTDDFGRIVFALVDSGWMSKTDEDNLEDFHHVYEFEAAFEDGYRIQCK